MKVVKLQADSRLWSQKPSGGTLTVLLLRLDQEWV